MAAEKEGGYARFRVRLDFRNLLQLAHCGCKVGNIRAAGSVPPALRTLWGRLEAQLGTDIKLYKRDGYGEQQVPDLILTNAMQADALDAINRKAPPRYIHCGVAEWRRSWIHGEDWVFFNTKKDATIWMAG